MSECCGGGKDCNWGCSYLVNFAWGGMGSETKCHSTARAGGECCLPAQSEEA